MDEQPDFEASLVKLEGLVSALERGDGTLATALAQYESGVHLLARCQTLLETAEKAVSLIASVQSDGTPKLTPFDATASVDRDVKNRPGRASSRKPVADPSSDPPF